MSSRTVSGRPPAFEHAADAVAPRDVPQPVALAAYFVASEALANVAKYAQATAVDVRLGIESSNLVIEIADDGVGGACPAGGSGLRGLADRVEARRGRPAARPRSSCVLRATNPAIVDFVGL
jgi:signal transduction histidine kinase